MHYKRYIVRDGVPVMPDTTSDNVTIMYTYLNGTRLDISKNSHDILDFGFIIETYDGSFVLNSITIRTFVRVRDKSTNKIYEGVSSGLNQGFTAGGLWPNISEV